MKVAIPPIHRPYHFATLPKNPQDLSDYDQIINPQQAKCGRAILLALFLVVMSATQSCAPEKRTKEQERIDKFLNDCELVDNGQWQFWENP